MTHDGEFLPIPGFPGYTVSRDLRVMGPKGLLKAAPSNGAVSLYSAELTKSVSKTPKALLKLALNITRPEESEVSPANAGEKAATESATPPPAAESAPVRPTVPVNSDAYFRLMRQNEELWRENAELREANAFLRKKLALNDDIIVNLATRIAVESVEARDE